MEKLTNKTIDKNNIDLVLYHGSCSDGFGSAFVVWYYYKNLYGLERANLINFIPCYYLKENQTLSNDFLGKLSGKNILMCDFSYKYNQLVQVINIAKSFMVLDHHKTAQEDLKKIPDDIKIFDMNRSGCGITWGFFNPDKQIPKFLAHIQDRDIWTYKIPYTLAFISYFHDIEYNFDIWEKYLDEETVNKAITNGISYLEYQNKLIDKITKKVTYTIQKINNQFIIVLYSNCPELKSDIGNKVFDRYPIGDFSCVWDYDLYKNQTAFSLRSTNDRLDVSEIASKLGGGGHRNASGILFFGLVAHLPFERIDDFGLLQMLLYGIKEKVFIMGEEKSYILFKVKEIREEWLKDDYLNLIKRKCQDCNLIVFEKRSETINIDNNGNLIPLNEYNVFYNEKSLEQSIGLLQYMASGSKEHIITFTSPKKFNELFSIEKSDDKNNNMFQTEDDDSNDDQNDDSNDSYDSINKDN